MPKILLVDDNPDTRFLNARILKQLGCTIIQCPSPVEALKMLETATAFDIIFSDLNMPIMNGIEFLDRLKTTHPEIPVILTSVSSNAELQNLARTKGAAYCLFGDFSKDHFETALKQATNKHFDSNSL